MRDLPLTLTILALSVLDACATVPRGVPGPTADALAREVQRSVDNDAWERTGAVRWTFAGAQHHLWDRRRNLARVRWGDHDVLLDVAHRTGVARRAGRVLTGTEAHDALDQAYRHWANDSFWLDPIAKLFDDGTERLRIADDGRYHHPSLVIAYRSGGVTPGDRYQWLLADNGRPYAWRMWVHIIPIAGLEASWDEWITLATGAVVATHHRIGPATVRLTDVAGAATLEALEPGPDPFAEIVSPQ